MADAIPVTAKRPPPVANKVSQAAVDEVAAMRASLQVASKAEDVALVATAEAAIAAGKNVISYANMIRVDN